VRGGLRDGHRRDRVAPPGALEACLAWGWEGMRGLVAESKASSRRPLGGWLAHQGERITRVPRPCAVRQALAAWGRAPPPCPCGWSTPGGRRPRRPGAGLATVCAPRCRAQTALGASPRRHCAAWSGMRVNGRSRPRRPRQPRQGPKPRPGPPTCGRDKPAGVPAGPRPKRRAPSMRAKGQAPAGVAPAPGGRTRSARAWRPTPAARAGPVAAGQRSWPHRRASRARVGRARWRPGPILPRPMGGQGGRRREARRTVQPWSVFRPLKTQTPPWHLVCGGSSIPQRALP